MASVLFSAIDRGYSARTILRYLGQRAPQYANAINNAYYYGYTANNILASIASKKDKKNYDPDMFLTDFEKTQRRDQDRKKNQLLGTLAAAGTLGAVGASMYALIQRNKAIQPQVLPALGGTKGAKGQKSPYTIHRQRPQIGNQQKQIAYNQQKQITNQQKQITNQQKQITYNQQKQIAYNQPQQPQQRQPLPFYPPQQQGSQVPPSNPPTPETPQGQSSNQPSMPAYNMKNVDLVHNFKEDSRFRNIIGYGLDKDATEFALRSTMPKDVISLMDRIEGGLSQVIKDYESYMKENPFKSAIEKNTNELKLQREKKEGFGVEEQNITPQQPLEASEQVGQIQLQKTSTEQKRTQEKQKTETIQPQDQITQKQLISPMEQPQIQKSQVPSKPLVSLKNGKIAEVENIKNGIATVNLDGKNHKEKSSDIKEEPSGIDDAVREIIGNIPENMKSTALQSMVHIPGMDILLTQFYDGKWAWYLDVPEDLYKNIALGTYQPKGQAITGIAEYKPGVADSRGAGFHNEIKINPKYSKENKGTTWGYASNEYALLSFIQKSLHKISKERYDEFGKLIVSKVRNKKTIK